MNIKVEVGGEYELNNGEKHKCTEMHGDDPLRVAGGWGPFVLGGRVYHQDGRIGVMDADHPLSVKRRIDAPGTGTIEELNLKTWDVVECVHSEYSTWTPGRRYTMTPSGLESDMSNNQMSSISTFRIVSRADQPGERETVAERPDTPKLWRDMTPEERDAIPRRYRDDPENPLRLPFKAMSEVGQGALLLADHKGKVIELWLKSGGCLQSIEFDAFDDIAYRVRPEPQSITLTVGGRYIDKEGFEYECIFIRGAEAWVAAVHGDNLDVAYKYSLDGKALSLGDKYDIVGEVVDRV